MLVFHLFARAKAILFLTYLVVVQALYLLAQETLLDVDLGRKTKITVCVKLPDTIATIVQTTDLVLGPSLHTFRASLWSWGCCLDIFIFSAAVVFCLFMCVCVHFVVVGVYMYMFFFYVCGCKWPKGLNDFNFTIKLC